MAVMITLKESLLDKTNKKIKNIIIYLLLLLVTRTHARQKTKNKIFILMLTTVVSGVSGCKCKSILSKSK